MPNQSGKIILVLIFIFLILSAGAYFLNLNFKEQKYQKATLKPSGKVARITNEGKNSLCRLNPNNKDNDQEGEIWEFLPLEFKNLTYKKGKISAGEATYQIYPLKWSNDCNFLPFLIELEARGGGAYQAEDYKYRGIYLLNVKTKEVIAAMKLPKNLFFEQDKYNSGLWRNGSYQFVLSESVKQGEFVSKRFSYDPTTNKLDKLVELP